MHDELTLERNEGSLFDIEATQPPFATKPIMDIYSSESEDK